MKQLNIYELQNTIYKKQQTRINVFSKVLEKCHFKIQSAAKKELYNCIYEVPEYVVGLPLYNINDCIDYIMRQLTENGFKVQYQFPKNILIDWKPVVSKTNTETNNNDLLLRYIPHRNNKGKFILNVD